MDGYEKFKPNSDEQAKWVEAYNTVSKWLSDRIRGLSEEKRLPYLREANPSDLGLINLYMQALKKEDHETCAVAKALLKERGYETPK